MRGGPGAALWAVIVIVLAACGVALGVVLAYESQLGARVRPPRVAVGAAGADTGAGETSTGETVAGETVAGETGAGGGGPLRLVHVARGEGFSRVVRRLVAQGSVSTGWPLRWSARRRGWDRSVAPGWYRFRPGETVRELLARLGRGEVERTRLTFPEGWRLSRALALLADSAEVPLDSLRAAASDSAWLARMDVPGPGLEGYLFPETYPVPRWESARTVLGPMLRRGTEFWEDSLSATALPLGWDRRRVWTLASMIEAEATRSEERARISAVFRNRLRLGMRLESDPTVLFALGRPPGALLNSDLLVDSPYNTYRNPGLPPGPICSPGSASLWAALHPQAGCTDLFFVARGDGSHVFSRSLDEHERARQVIRQRQAVVGIKTKVRGRSG